MELTDIGTKVKAIRDAGYSISVIPPQFYKRGRGCEARTRDKRIKSPLLYQLS